MYDDDLQYRLELLKEQIEAGKLKVAPHLTDGVRASLAAVKYGPDGKIDLATVDGRVRSLALMVAHFKQREDVKDAASLRHVQAAYFQSIENNFGDLFRDMQEAGASPHQYAAVLSSDDENVEYLYPVISEFMGALTEFWTDASEVVSYHLQDLSAVKGVFGGDLFPVENIASTCGLYLDTIVLTDPFMNSRGLFTRWENREAVRYFVKNAMNVLSYKELALADVDPPIIAILPFESSFNKEHSDTIAEWARTDALIHAGKLFGREFSSMQELVEFCEKLDTPEMAVRELVDPSRLLFDVDWTDSTEKQIDRALKEFGTISGANNAGSLIAAQCFGRMMQATDLLVKSRSLGGTPLIEAPTSWRYFNWKLEYDAPVSDDNLPLHILEGLQWAGKNEVQWLGNIPPQALIEMRQQGAVEEIRSVLTAGVEQVEETDATNFISVGRKIVENINDAFARHQEAIDEVKRKNLRFWGHDIGTWIVTGAIEVGAAVAGTPLFGLASFAASQVTDAPKLKDLPKRFKELEKERSEAQKSPLGLFFKHRK
jgi:hypothetical protein